MFVQCQHIDTVTFVIWACFKFDLILTPVTPNDPRWNFEIVTFVEGLKLYHIHKSHDHAT